MKIGIPAAPKKFSAMKPGGFFKSLRRKDFGICVSIDGDALAAIIFPETSAPRLQIGGLPSDVVNYPDAILRVRNTEFGSDEIGFGAIIATDGRSYIRVADGFDSYRTFDLATGLQANLPDDVSRIYYNHWKVGIPVDGKFEEICAWAVP